MVDSQDLLFGVDGFYPYSLQTNRNIKVNGARIITFDFINHETYTKINLQVVAAVED